jgi:membrane protein implicated in regulation of membrane protease activity
VRPVGSARLVASTPVARPVVRDGGCVNIWFWAWVLLAAIFAVMELFDRDYYTLPWAFGAAAAALLDALRVDVAWEWAAFFGLSSAILIGIQRFRAPSRRSLRKRKRAES